MTGFEVDRRFVLELGDEQASEGWKDRRIVIRFMEDAKGFHVLVEDVRPVFPHYQEETRIVHVETYWLCSHVSDNVPRKLNDRRVTNIVALLFTAHGPALTNILWSLFYELVIEAAYEDDGHWLHFAAPKFAKFYCKHISESQRKQVAEVMES